MILMTATTSAFGQSLPLEVPAPVEKLFVPQGFDDNDNAEIVIHGVFPNSCWRMGKSGVTVDEDNFTIDVWTTAFQYNPENSSDKEVLCAQVMVPYIAPIKTGILKAGTYTVQVRDQNISAILDVNTATTESPDDYLYAMVNAAGVDVDPISQQQTVWVRGVHPHFIQGCMVMDEIRAYKNPEDVLIVLPIGRMTDGVECGDDYKYNFFQRVPLNDSITTESLLHVRAMNGRSYNELLQLD
jgi:hypothetical protein